MTDIEPIAVEVVYALPHKQKLLNFLVSPGTTALQAAEKSGICQFFPELDLANSEMGVFSQTLGVKGIEPPASYILKSGDRVEIYRPLVSDPKEVRRRLAARQKAEADAQGKAETKVAVKGDGAD